jgi:hypothetical protein
VRVEEADVTKETGAMDGVVTTGRGVPGDAMTRICNAEFRQAATIVGALVLGPHACVTRTVDESVIDLGLIGSVGFARAGEVTRTITLRVGTTGTPVAWHVKKMARPRPWQRCRSRPVGNGARLGTTLTVG